MSDVRFKFPPFDFAFERVVHERCTHCAKYEEKKDLHDFWYEYLCQEIYNAWYGEPSALSIDRDGGCDCDEFVEDENNPRPMRDAKTADMFGDERANRERSNAEY